MITSRLVLWSALLLAPSLSHAVSLNHVAFSIARTGHNAFCIVDLNGSAEGKLMAAKGILHGNFDDIRTHNKELWGMSDEEFGAYMRGEVWKVARCHPMASDLLGNLPGTDYLAPLDMVTTVPASVDRKVTYSIWAYDLMYRSVHEYVDELKTTANAVANGAGNGAQSIEQRLTGGAPRPSGQLLPGAVPMPDDAPVPEQQGSEGKQRASDANHTSAQRAAEQARNLVARVRAGLRPAPLSEIPGPDDAPPAVQATDDGETRGSSFPGLEAAERLLGRMESMTPPEVAEGHSGTVIRDWLRDEGGEQIGGDIGDVRPTVSVYALVGRELAMYEIQTVHLLFSSSTGPAQFCYERYNPDFPAFARLFNAGRATQQAVTTLPQEEATELLKFFNAAASTQAESFILSDLAAVAGRASDEGAGNALANCVRLAQKDNLQEDTGSPRWERGSVIRFETEDKLWQTLITMLAAKRIQVAQESKAY